MAAVAAVKLKVGTYHALTM